MTYGDWCDAERLRREIADAARECDAVGSMASEWAKWDARLRDLRAQLQRVLRVGGVA